MLTFKLSNLNATYCLTRLRVYGRAGTSARLYTWDIFSGFTRITINVTRSCFCCHCCTPKCSLCPLLPHRKNPHKYYFYTWKRGWTKASRSLRQEDASKNVLVLSDEASIQPCCVSDPFQQHGYIFTSCQLMSITCTAKRNTLGHIEDV